MHTQLFPFFFKQDFIQSKEIYNAMYVRSSSSLNLPNDDRTKQNNIL